VGKLFLCLKLTHVYWQADAVYSNTEWFSTCRHVSGCAELTFRNCKQLVSVPLHSCPDMVWFFRLSVSFISLLFPTFSFSTMARQFHFSGSIELLRVCYLRVSSIIYPFSFLLIVNLHSVPFSLFNIPHILVLISAFSPWLFNNYNIIFLRNHIRTEYILNNI
jgi:hypothetical protein